MSISISTDHFRAIAAQVKEAADAGDNVAFSPRTTSLSVVRAQTQQDAAEERFFRKLDEEVWMRLWSKAVYVIAANTGYNVTSIVLVGN